MSLAKKINIKIGENTYEVTFPNTGQFIDIETNKIAFANGKYKELQSSGMVTAQLATNLVEAIAVFNILIPKFKDDLNVKSIFDLDLIHAKSITKAYIDIFIPWYIDWIKELTKEDIVENTPTSNTID